MIKQVLITSIAAAGLLVAAQASAHNSGGTVTVWKNSNASSHGHKHHVKKVRRAPPKYNVNKEQRQQAAMIKQGIQTCQITPKEAKKLNERQARIKKAERRMRSDGLSYNESMKLKKRLHNARVQINKLTQNANKCGRGHKKHSQGHGHGHSHGGNKHSHTNSKKRHSHTTNGWSKQNQYGTFSISFGH